MLEFSCVWKAEFNCISLVMGYLIKKIVISSHVVISIASVQYTKHFCKRHCPLGEVLGTVVQCWAPDASWDGCASWI